MSSAVMRCAASAVNSGAAATVRCTASRATGLSCAIHGVSVDVALMMA